MARWQRRSYGSPGCELLRRNDPMRDGEALRIRYFLGLHKRGFQVEWESSADLPQVKEMEPYPTIVLKNGTWYVKGARHG